MTSHSLARDASATASLYSGYLASIGRDPDRWQWPTSTAQYLRYRIADLAADLLLSGATEAVVA